MAWGTPAERISVSFIGVDCRRFSPGPVPLTAREPPVLYVGRLVEKKAPLVLLRAFAHLARVVPAARLVMIGDGPFRTAAGQLARDAALPVTFTRTLDPPQVSSYLAQTRVFCLPRATAANADAEGLPISLLEAQASGVPVVTTAHGGNPEAVDAGCSGFIVPEGDREALAARLICALTDGDFLATASGHAVAPGQGLLPLGQAFTVATALAPARESALPRIEHYSDVAGHRWPRFAPSDGYGGSVVDAGGLARPVARRGRDRLTGRARDVALRHAGSEAVGAGVKEAQIGRPEGGPLGSTGTELAWR